MVLDWCAQLLPSIHSLPSSLVVVERLHLRAWIHWCRRFSLHSLHSWKVQERKRQRSLLYMLGK
jgi:hypothetical protein